MSKPSQESDKGSVPVKPLTMAAAVAALDVALQRAEVVGGARRRVEDAFLGAVSCGGGGFRV